MILLRLICLNGLVGFLTLEFLNLPLATTLKNGQISHPTSHFESFLQKIQKLFFLNQVRGIPIGNDPVSKHTRSCSNDQIQCSSHGPNIFSPPVPTFSRNENRLHFSFNSVAIIKVNVPFVGAFVANNKNKRHWSLSNFDQFGLKN